MTFPCDMVDMDMVNMDMMDEDNDNNRDISQIWNVCREFNKKFWSISYIWDVYQGSSRGPVQTPWSCFYTNYFHCDKTSYFIDQLSFTSNKAVNPA